MSTLLSSPSSDGAMCAAGAPRHLRFMFAVFADPEPGVMPRVLEQFAKRDLVPTRWHSVLVEGPDAELQIDVQVDDLEHETGLYIARCVAAQVNVREVLTTTA